MNSSVEYSSADPIVLFKCVVTCKCQSFGQFMTTWVPGGPFEELYLLKVIVGCLCYELRQCIIFSYLRLAVNYIN